MNDTSHDWRDRILHGAAAWESLDVRPGGAAQAAINDLGQQTIRAAFTGLGRPSGGTVLSNSQYTRSTDGALCVRNDMGGTLYLVGSLEALFPPGPRSR